MGRPGQRFLAPAVLTAPFRPSSTDELNAKLLSMASAAGETIGGDTLELAADVFTVTKTIKIPAHVHLVGRGPGTTLQAGPAMTGTMIANNAANDRRFGVHNLTIDGNGRPVVGLSFNTPSVGGQEYADGMYEAEHLDILDCGSGSMVFAGRGEGKVSFIKIRDSGGIGIDCPAVDNHFFNITIGGCQSTGIRVTGANNRFSDCKPYYCGLSDNVNGHGWLIKDTLLCTFVNCEAQDCTCHGFLLDGSDHIDLNGVVADSNGAGHNGLVFAGNGIEVYNSDYAMVRARARERNVNTTKQKYGLSLSGWTSIASVDLMASGNQSGNTHNTTGSTISGRVNGVVGNIT